MPVRQRPLALLLGVSLLGGIVVRADEITYRDEEGALVTTQARLVGTGQGFQALERWDGQIQIVPSGAIQDRENTGDPTPATSEQLAEIIRQRFGADLCRIQLKRNLVVALVLAGPLDRSAEGRADQFLKKAMRFMDSVDDVFAKYARTMRLPLQDSKFPLVLLIFESDEDFNDYTVEATGGSGLSAGSILGFYSQLTNWLAVRMSSCDSFEVPLHEAIHQQVYNRLLARLAPIPKWFDEGIATGFEGSGERIDVSPVRVNAHYAVRVLNRSERLDWGKIIAEDNSFNTDVLAGDAYTQAWGLHWALVTQQKENYRKYVLELARREPLSTDPEEKRAAHFEGIFEVPIAELQSQFLKTLPLAARRQNVDLSDTTPIGRATRQQALGEYDIQAVRRSDRGGQLQVGGTIKNISPLRAMTFYVTLETETGTYADWLVPDVKPNQLSPLRTQIAMKHVQGVAGGTADAFRVWVRSAPAESERAQEWKTGRVPGPVLGAN